MELPFWIAFFSLSPERSDLCQFTLIYFCFLSDVYLVPSLLFFLLPLCCVVFFAFPPRPKNNRRKENPFLG